MNEYSLFLVFLFHVYIDIRLKNFLAKRNKNVKIRKFELIFFPYALLIFIRRNHFYLFAILLWSNDPKI